MIKLVKIKISQTELLEICQSHFTTMVKFVVDVNQAVVAIGGEMHADAEAFLLEHGSQQKDLWGGNFYPWNEPDRRLEYTSFINIRPVDDNMGMEIMDTGIKNKVRAIIESLVLSPNEKLEPLI